MAEYYDVTEAMVVVAVDGSSGADGRGSGGCALECYGTPKQTSAGMRGICYHDIPLITYLLGSREL